MPRAKRTELNDDQRKSVLCHLLERRNAERKNGLEYGAINSAAEKFHTTTKSKSMYSLLFGNWTFKVERREYVFA